MDALNYQSRVSSPPRSRGWILVASIATVIDLAFAFFVGRRIVVDGSYGGIYGFGGYARPMILLSSVVNVVAFFLVVAALILSTNRYRWWLCAAFAAHAFVGAIFLGVGYGLL